MNILINGGEGFIASNLNIYLTNIGHTVFAPSHTQLDVMVADNIKQFFDEHEIDVVIHTIAKGGRRIRKDVMSDCYDTLLMFENMRTYSKCKLFINFGSGMEFDGRFNITEVKEDDIFIRVPIDPYGLAKNIISRRMSGIPRCVNLRIFNCFGYNEAWHRLIRVAITSAIENKPITVVDRKVDFFYIQDLCKVVEYAIKNHISCGDINCVYPKKYKVVDVVKMVQEVVGCNNEIIISDKQPDYTGDGNKLLELSLYAGLGKLIGLQKGIEETYQKIKAQINV